MNMRICLLWQVLAVLVIGIIPMNGLAQDKPTVNNRVCITFDNLPAENYYTREERIDITDSILAALDRHGAKAVGFVVGEHVAGDWDLLIKWLDRGHVLGFQTFSGQNIYDAPPEVFIGDIAKGRDAIEDILEVYRIGDRYFRYPLLHYGDEYDVKMQIETYLYENEMTAVPATILVEDFVYNLSLENLLKRRDSAGVEQLRGEYVEHILSRVAAAEDLAMEVVGRPVRHILQLRASRLNGLFLEDVLKTLEEKGYKFITLNTALKDDIYQWADNYFGHKVVSFLDRIREPKVIDKK